MIYSSWWLDPLEVGVISLPSFWWLCSERLLLYRNGVNILILSGAGFYLHKFRSTLLLCCFLESLGKLWFKESVGGCGRNVSRDGSTAHQRCSSSLQLIWHHLEVRFLSCWDSVLYQRFLQHLQKHKTGNVWRVFFLADLLVLNNQFQSFLNLSFLNQSSF